MSWRQRGRRCSGRDGDVTGRGRFPVIHESSYEKEDENAMNLDELGAVGGAAGGAVGGAVEGAAGWTDEEIQKENNPAISHGGKVSLKNSLPLLQRFLTRAMQEVDLVHNHPSVCVQVYKDPPERALRPYRVRRVVSPYEFILEYALDGQEFDYNKWYPEMQNFYRDEKNKDFIKLDPKTDLICPNACYVCKDFPGGKWHRVRVHNINHSKNTVSVFFIDLLKLQEASINALAKLNPTFARFPAPLLRGYLYDIAPKHDGNPSFASATTPWSRQAIEYFQDAILTKNKTYQGIIFTRSDKMVTRGVMDIYQNVGVVLIDKNTKKTLECTLNAKMVDAGYAVPTGIFACCQHTTQVDGVPTPIFDKDKHGQLSPPDPSTSGGPAPSVPSKEVLQKYRSLYQNWDDIDPMISFKRHNVFHKSDNTMLSKNVADKLCKVKLVFVQGPGAMILHLQSLADDFEQMQFCIQHHVAAKKPLEEDDIHPGMFIACYIVALVNDGTEVWCRAVVKDKMMTAGSIFKVLLTDYGTEVGVNIKKMRALPDHFVKIPSFAIRVHLDLPSCIPKLGEFWTTEAIIRFRGLIYNWDKEEPEFFIHRPPTSTVIDLQDFYQNVHYHQWEQKWGPAPYHKESMLVSMKDEPIIRSLFVSIGVDLKFEIKVEKSLFWHFGSVSEFLMYNRNFVKDVAKKKDLEDEEGLEEWKKTKKRIHQEIFGETVNLIEPLMDVTVTTERNPPVFKERATTSIKPPKTSNLLMKALLNCQKGKGGFN